MMIVLFLFGKYLISKQMFIHILVVLSYHLHMMYFVFQARDSWFQTILDAIPKDDRKYSLVVCPSSICPFVDVFCWRQGHMLMSQKQISPTQLDLVSGKLSLYWQPVMYVRTHY